MRAYRRMRAEASSVEAPATSSPGHSARLARLLKLVKNNFATDLKQLPAIVWFACPSMEAKNILANAQIIVVEALLRPANAIET